MKALALKKYGSTDLLSLEETPRPTPKDDEVLIKVHAAAVNDWDWNMVRGKPFYMRLLCGLLRPKIGIPGVEISGQVISTGRKTEKFKPGDHVYGDLSEAGFGAFAEYTCAPENALGKKPACMSFIDAAALPHAAMLAIQGLIDVGKIQPGQKLLINGGGGGVGLLGVQIAKSLGIDDITGVDSASKAEAMRLAGYARTIDYRSDDFTRMGEAYDLILDTKTNRSPFRYLHSLKEGGLYATVGGQTLPLLQLVALAPLIHRFSSKRLRMVVLKTNRDLDYINQLYETGDLKPIIDGPYPFSEIASAIQLFGEGKHIGKVAINIS